MEKDITLAQVAAAFQVLLHSSPTSKETPSKSGGKKWGKKNTEKSKQYNLDFI